MMYEDRYDLTDIEAAHAKELLATLATHGILIKINFTTGQPVLTANGPVSLPFVPLRGSPAKKMLPRFVVASDGRVWPFVSRGADKCPHLPDGGGSPSLSDYVEMWTGKWRKIEHPDKPGKMTFAKNTVSINVESQVQGYPGVSKIEYMKQKKGFKHPLDDPQCPTASDLAAIDAKLRKRAPVILAQMREELAASKTEGAESILAEAAANLERQAAPVEGMAAIQAAEAAKPKPLVMEVPEVDPTPVAPVTQNVRISDLAREFAGANGIDLASVTGTGCNGRIVIEDVRKLVPAAESPEPVAPAGRTNQHANA